MQLFVLASYTLMIYSELARLLAAMPHTLSAAAQAGNAIAEDKAKQLLYLDLKK